MAAAEDARRQVLAAVTIADLAGQVGADHGPRVMNGIRNWLTAPTG